MRPPQKKTKNKNLKDCQLKGAILQALAANGNNCTSRQIFNRIEYKNYNSLRVSINRYVKQGYLRKHGNKKPFYYSLTKKGFEHAKDPLILKKKRNFLYWKHVSQMLENEEEFMHGVLKFIQYQPEAALREICKSPYFRGDNTYHGMYKKMLDEQAREIHFLREFIHELGYRF